MSKVDTVRGFCEKLQTDESMRSAVNGAETDEQIFEIATRLGFEFGREDIVEAVDGGHLKEFIGDPHDLDEDALRSVNAAGGPPSTGAVGELVRSVTPIKPWSRDSRPSWMDRD